MIEVTKKTSPKEPKFKFNFFCSKYNQQIGFSVFDLPLSFDKCYQTYVTSKCELCQERADKNDFGVCLTCGMLMCAHACKGLENQSGKSKKLTGKPKALWAISASITCRSTPGRGLTSM